VLRSLRDRVVGVLAVLVEVVRPVVFVAWNMWPLRPRTVADLRVEEQSDGFLGGLCSSMSTSVMYDTGLNVHSQNQDLLCCGQIKTLMFQRLRECSPRLCPSPKTAWAAHDENPQLQWKIACACVVSWRLVSSVFGLGIESEASLSATVGWFCD
jgi:hypothetical protein